LPAFTVAEAAALLSVNERTVRRWAAAGELPSVTIRGKRGPELRLDRAAVLAHRLLIGNADRPDSGDAGKPGEPDRERDKAGTEAGKADSLSASLAVLQARLDGAHLAAKLHAARRREAREALRQAEERAAAREAQLTAELEFLRGQIQQRTDAERELRLLLAQATQARTVPALEAAGSTPAPRRWWAWWRR
jgi:excisionase family DNA binding protein